MPALLAILMCSIISCNEAAWSDSGHWTICGLRMWGVRAVSGAGYKSRLGGVGLLRGEEQGGGGTRARERGMGHRITVSRGRMFVLHICYIVYRCVTSMLDSVQMCYMYVI